MKKLLLLFSVLLVTIGLKAESIVPEGTVYDEGYYGDDPDLGVANGATYNPAIEYTYTVAAPATVESIVPEANTEITEIGNFVFTFSDDVTVESAKIQLGPGNIQDVPTRLIMTKGKVATIDLSALAEDLKSNGRFNIILKVKDSKGLYITYGSVESYVSAGYTVSTEIVRNTFEPLEVEPAKESTVESLKVVQLTFIDKLNRLGSFVGAVDLTKKAQLLDSNNNKVADGILAEVQLDPTDFLPGAVSVTLDSEITKDGEYTLVIPEQAIYNAEANPDDPDFGIANEMDPGAIIYNPELKYTYTVSSPVTFTTNPENESSLDEIPANVVFTFNKEVTITEAYLVLGRGNSTDITESITTKIGTEITVPVPADKRDQILENRFFTISLNGENDLSAQATYNMIVPMNTLELQKAAPADNSTVESLSTITLTYGVAGTSMIDPGTPISGIDASKKEVQLLNADKTVAATGIISVVDELDILVTLNQTITNEGTYTLTIPEATVYDGNADIADWDNSYVDVESEFTKQATYNPEITLTYKILASGINVIQAALTGEVSVYSVQGILLRKGDASVVLNDLAEGIYIVNGQKMAISK